MRPFVSLVLVAAMANPLYAANSCGARVAVRHNNTVFVNVNRGFVPTTFLVPAFVPVAPYSSYYYAQVPNPEPQVDPENPPLSARVKASAPQVELTTAEMIVEAKCVKCHSGEHPKGGLSLVVGVDQKLSDILSPDDKQKMLLRVLSTDAKLRMPKGGNQLTTGEFKTLLESFVH